MNAFIAQPAQHAASQMRTDADHARTFRQHREIRRLARPARGRH